MKKQFYAIKIFFISLLLLAGMGNALQAQTITLETLNWTTGGSGVTARKGDWMHYQITVTNTTSSNLSTSTVLDNILNC